MEIFLVYLTLNGGEVKWKAGGYLLDEKTTRLLNKLIRFFIYLTVAFLIFIAISIIIAVLIPILNREVIHYTVPGGTITPVEQNITPP